MKKILVFGLLLMLGILLVSCVSAPDDVESAEIVDEDVTAATLSEDAVAENVDMELSSFEFEGYAGVKSHVGTFEDFEAVLYVLDGEIVGAEGVIMASSVKTDSEKLDGHLKNDDFFDVEVYPEIRFDNGVVSGANIVGDLTFHGVTKTISIPVTVTETTLTTDFLLDTTDFGMKYSGVDKDVRIAFVLVLN